MSKSKNFVQDITEQTRNILGSKFVDTLLSILGLAYLSTGTAIPILLISGIKLFSGGLAKDIAGNDVVHVLLKMGIVGNAPQYIGLPVLLTIIMRMVNENKTDKKSKQKGGSLKNIIGNDLLYTYITHPKSTNIYSIYSKEGLDVVKQYLHTSQKGGHNGSCSSCKKPPPPSFYNKSSHNQDNNFDENIPYNDTEFVQEGG